MQIEAIISLMGYFALMLGIGFYAYKTSTDDVSGYMLGGRKLHPAVGALSAGASDMSGWMLMGLPGAIYVSGLGAAWIAVGLVIGAYFNYLLVAPRLRVFTEVADDAITIPDYFEKRFNDKTRISAAADFLPKALDALEAKGACEMRGEADAIKLDPRIKPLAANDFGTEFLDAVLSVKIVDGLDEGIAFVAEHSSNHTDAIMAEDAAAAERFLTEIDSAVVMHNASTQFSDGGEFGMGAEIGIATGKMHARGPVGLEQLTSFKYRVRGVGQTRP